MDPRGLAKHTIETLVDVFDMVPDDDGKRAKALVEDAESLKEGAFAKATMMEVITQRMTDVVRELDQKQHIAARMLDWSMTTNQRLESPLVFADAESLEAYVKSHIDALAGEILAPPPGQHPRAAEVVEKTVAAYPQRPDQVNAGEIERLQLANVSLDEEPPSGRPQS